MCQALSLFRVGLCALPAPVLIESGLCHYALPGVLVVRPSYIVMAHGTRCGLDGDACAIEVAPANWPLPRAFITSQCRSTKLTVRLPELLMACHGGWLSVRSYSDAASLAARGFPSARAVPEPCGWWGLRLVVGYGYSSGAYAGLFAVRFGP